MKLFIDTSNNKKIIVKFGKRRLVRIIEIGETQKLVSLINKIIKKPDSSINRRLSANRRISEIEVNLGPGSFTGLRVGVSVANALAWALKIPINGKRGVVVPIYE